MKLNVLHINKFHYMRGGSETIYFETAKLLESHGHKSLFFSMQHPENLSCETRNYFMPYVDLNTNSNGIINQLKSTGRILYSLKAKKLLSKLLNEYPLDIVHLHNIHHQISPSILHILKKRKIPVVMTLHDYKMVCASYLMMANGKNCEACSGGNYLAVIKNKCVKGSLAKSCLAALEMYMHHRFFDIYNNVDAFISPSFFLKKKLAEMGFRKKIIHLPNFIDTEKFGKVKGGENGRENSLVYFGRLAPEKGLYTLIKATKLLNTNCKVGIKIIGDGQIKVDLEEKAKSEGNSNIQFLGYMKGVSLYKEIKKCLAVVLPSEWYENNPMSVLEAFALGVPVIGAKIGGIPELVKEGITGLTFESGNAHELAEKIRYVLDNPGKVAKMGENARVFVEQNLNAEKYYQGLINIYQSAIGKY
ncbi:MAG: glycosyltransferase family 4 protein [Candidatus Kuenenia stuttgartiensis]|nr:glycosyltransferase family 4 protein [Candidatus Kuenenia stuttgartiensis]